MRRMIRLSVLCIAVSACSASSPDKVTSTPDIPTSGVRFINAVPDTNAMDFRFVDIIENNAQYRIPFRNNPVTSAGITASTQIEFKNTKAGQRNFRIFLSDTLQSVASTVLKDTTVTIAAGKYYTAIMWGSARAGSMHLTWIEENIPDPGTNVGLRVINATTGAVDVKEYPSSGVPPATATWASIPAMSLSSFMTAAPDRIKFNVTAAGSGVPMFADGLALVGAPAAVDLEGLPGTTIAGSSVSAVIFPPSVAGSKAAQFAAPGMSFMWDRRPPRLPGS